MASIFLSIPSRKVLTEIMAAIAADEGKIYYYKRNYSWRVIKVML